MSTPRFPLRRFPPPPPLLFVSCVFFFCLFVCSFFVRDGGCCCEEKRFLVPSLAFFPLCAAVARCSLCYCTRATELYVGIWYSKSASCCLISLSSSLSGGEVGGGVGVVRSR
jgi:hypothetical protein